MPPGAPLTNDKRGGDDFQQRQNGQHFPGELVMHGLVHEFIARAQDLRSAEIADHTNDQSGSGRLQILSPARPCSQARPEVADRLGKDHRGQSANNSQHRVSQQLRGPHQAYRRDAK